MWLSVVCLHVSVCVCGSHLHSLTHSAPTISLTRLSCDAELPNQMCHNTKSSSPMHAFFPKAHQASQWDCVKCYKQEKLLTFVEGTHFIKMKKKERKYNTKYMNIFGLGEKRKWLSAYFTYKTTSCFFFCVKFYWKWCLFNDQFFHIALLLVDDYFERKKKWKKKKRKKNIQILCSIYSFLFPHASHMKHIHTTNSHILHTKSNR